ncbi:lipopolysaccharide biosynthesis protein [Acinetobacter sp. ANC 3882]|uniref:lipopolysaccharide biosynthesis protein n=1 Tax=Acinetobacter sp. ANC 3882 TaxID=2923423 RepID=UPI001F4AF767|nr:lipopolysaccharide biosynthesis protein [Acinetobacter sp. ANC 3882]MCH7314654.1 lipopolysaccharide biosynthesis protein [Acinetobacter sp. ANC 3882]
MVRFFSGRISRSIYKLIYKIFFPKAAKHNRRYWPLYTVERDSQNRIEKIYFRKSLVSNNLIPQPISHKKCMLVATGPSIQDLDPKILHRSDLDYIGVNGAIAFDSISFSSYVIIDHNFVGCRFDLVKKVLNSNCIFFTTPRCLDMILRQVRIEDIHCQIKTIETITDGHVESFLDYAKHFDQNEKDFFIHKGFGFSLDIYKGAFDYFTVAYVAFQILYTQGYKEIYLAGLDMNNFSQPRFYEDTEKQQPTTLNHHLDEVFQAFDTVAVLFKEKDIQVFNLSRTSAVQAFEKIDPNIII